MAETETVTLDDLARSEEATAQGVKTPADTTQNALAAVSREEEADAKLADDEESVAIGEDSFAMAALAEPGTPREEPSEETDREQELKEQRDAT